MAEAGWSAFELFVAEHGDRLLHTAYGLCGDWQHAEDLVQQALTAVARRWDVIETNPLGYAYRCVARTNIDRWRALRRRPEVLLDPRHLATTGAAVSDTLDDGTVAARTAGTAPTAARHRRPALPAGPVRGRHRRRARHQHRCREERRVPRCGPASADIFSGGQP